MTELSNKKEETMFNVGDIISISMKIDFKIPEEDYDKKEVFLDDYSAELSISYTLPENIPYMDYSLDAEPGYCTIFDYDIKSYIEEYLSNDIREIEDYEIFDINNESVESQTAKIRVKSLK